MAPGAGPYDCDVTPLPDRVLVVGLARSGRASASVLGRRGVEVVAFDADPAADVDGLEAHVVRGTWEGSLLEGVGLLVKSPGVPAAAQPVVDARAHGVPVISEIELGARLLPNPMIGVTGTNGKTTTTALLGAILEAAAYPVEVAGNIGRPLTLLVDEADAAAWVVCELSSFQLEDVDELRPRVAVLTNLEPDHLDRHGDFGAYAAAKLRVFARQGPDDVAVLPRGFAPVPGDARRVEFSADDPLPAEPRIRGAHNRANAAAATAAARAIGVSDHAIADALQAFPGVEHRIEEVATVDGVLYVNDSKATNAAAALRALGSFAGRRKHVILGGRGKAEPYDALAGAFEPGDRAYLIGEAADELATALEAADVELRRSGSLAEAVSAASAAASTGDVVLLSPACASFDQFESFEHRGQEFRRLVEKLAGVGSRRRSDRGQLEQRLLILVTLGLVAFGSWMVFSATSASAALGEGDPMRFLVKQGLYACVGLVLLAALTRVDYHALRPLAPLLLVGALAACVAVLLVAPPINGAQRWFVFGPVSFQPAELAKLAVCLWVCAVLARRPAPRTLGELMKPVGIVVVLFGGLIVIEPDLGTTISLFLMVAGILLVSGIPFRVLALAGSFAVAAGLLAIWMEPYRRERVFSFLDPWQDAQGAGFQNVQAVIGMGSGGITGEGLGQGIQKVNFLAGGAHGHDLRRRRRGARLSRLGRGHRGVRSLRLGRFPDRPPVSRSVRQAPRRGDHDPRLRPGCSQPRRGARHRAADRDPAAVRLVRGSSLLVLLAGVGVLLNIAVNERVVEARVRDRGRGNRRARPASARGGGGAARPRSDRDVRRHSRPRRVAAGA